MKKKSQNHAAIQIECRSFSIACLPTTVWAEGGAGWFELQPSNIYKAQHVKIAQAIELYFGIVAVYEDAKKSNKRGWHKALTVEEVLENVSIPVRLHSTWRGCR